MLANHQAASILLDSDESLEKGPDIFSSININKDTISTRVTESKDPEVKPSTEATAGFGATNKEDMEGSANTHTVCVDKSRTPTLALRPARYSPKPRAKLPAQVDNEGNDEVSADDPDDWVSRNIQFDKEDNPVNMSTGANQLFIAFMPSITNVPPDQCVQAGLHLIISTLHGIDEKSEVHPIDVNSSAPILRSDNILPVDIECAKYFVTTNPRSLVPATGVDNDGCPRKQPNIYLTLKIMSTGRAKTIAGKMNMILNKKGDQIFFDFKKSKRFILC